MKPKAIAKSLPPQPTSSYPSLMIGNETLLSGIELENVLLNNTKATQKKDILTANATFEKLQSTSENSSSKNSFEQ